MSAVWGWVVGLVTALCVWLRLRSTTPAPRPRPPALPAPPPPPPDTRPAEVALEAQAARALAREPRSGAEALEEARAARLRAEGET